MSTSLRLSVKDKLGLRLADHSSLPKRPTLQQAEQPTAPEAGGNNASRKLSSLVRRTQH